MTMIFSKIIRKITLNPKVLFLIDGFGALLSAFLLGVILTKFESIFGMPRKALYFLSFLPFVFAVYSFVCYLRISKTWSLFLRIIAISNLMYCGISVGLVFYHYQKLTSLGLIYFLLEFVIIIVLASIELKTAAQFTAEKK